MNNNRGFTLLEILIALFIFTILSLLLVSGLRTVINTQSGTEEKATRLHELQMTLLVLSRDIEQAVNRPIINANGKEELAFVGKPDGLQLTHTGLANTQGIMHVQSSLQRTGYALQENSFVRNSFPALDQAPESKANKRTLLTNITNIRFEYLDNNGRFHDNWPQDSENQPLPRGVRIHVTVNNWGKMTQLYLVPGATP